MAAACTPRKLVHWAGDNDINEYSYGTPGSDCSSNASMNSTSTLQYVNSQLIAHGFTNSPGLSLEGTSKEDEERTVKCMLAMLSQRMEDMARTESLSTKLRTLTYEHERLSSIHHTTEEKLASAERETNLFKQRLAGANKALQASENAHKATSAELQRARSSLHSVRQTHAAELKRKEKETEKMVERWAKISDTQVKLGSTAAGLSVKFTLANPVASSRDGEIVGKERGLLEDALEEAEEARKALSEENASLKNVVLAAANELARATHRDEQDEDDERVYFTMEDIFSLSAPGSPSENLKKLLNSVRDTIRNLTGEVTPTSTTPAGEPPVAVTCPASKVDDDNAQRDQSKEMLRLQNTIIDLRRQLEQAQVQKQSGTYADQAQAIVRRFVEDDTAKAGPVNRADERGVLERLRKELDSARLKVDEAALRLKDEKDALEDERQTFHRERRLWKSQMGILHDNEPEAGPSTGLGAYFDAPAEPLALEYPFHASPQRSARKPKKFKSPKKASTKAGASMNHKSPAKPVFAVGKIKKGRGSLSRKPPGISLGASTTKPKVIPPMETEVIPSTLTASRTGPSLIVPTAFVLPPPSPMTSIPPQPELLSSFKPLQAPALTLSDESSSSSSSGQASSSQVPLPTPGAPLPFPMAKPFAPHMIHAYSPARPSPLSRILMLGDSPSEAPAQAKLSVNFEPQGSAHQGDEAEPQQQQMTTIPSYGTVMSLEEELGLDAEESPSDESPLREKNIRMVNKGKGRKEGPARGMSGGRKEGKGRSNSARDVRTALETEKENVLKKARAGMALAPPAARLTGVTKGGARRVPIGSADAAPMGRGWK